MVNDSYVSPVSDIGDPSEPSEENIKVLLLTDRPEYIIGNVLELDEEPSILIENCFSVSGDGTLSPFPLYTDQRDLFLTSEGVFTIVDPTEKLLETYRSA
jgi:hypothetical protein